jgi:hypothetical protein
MKSLKGRLPSLEQMEFAEFVRRIDYWDITFKLRYRLHCDVGILLAQKVLTVLYLTRLHSNANGNERIYMLPYSLRWWYVWLGPMSEKNDAKVLSLQGVQHLKLSQNAMWHDSTRFWRQPRAVFLVIRHLWSELLHCELLRKKLGL